MRTLSTCQNRRISSVGARSLPAGRVVTQVVQQPVHLSPMGNTVAMTVGAEMPFASGRKIVISTQASGGVSQAPDDWRSRARNGIFSGLGEPMRSTLTRSTAQQIATGDQTGIDADTIAEANAIMDGTMLAQDDPGSSAPAPTQAAPVTTTAPASSSFDWSKIGQTLAPIATTGANIYNSTRPKNPIPTSTPSYRAPASSNTKTYLIIGGVAAVGLLAFILLRKKGGAAPATNPRRRR